MLSEQDVKMLHQMGISEEQLEQQLARFKSGFPQLDIVKAAVLKDGIKPLTEHKIESYLKVYKKASPRLKRIKFVPTSGAATRMFSQHFQFLNTYKGMEEEYLKILSDNGFYSINYMCDNIKKFAFYNDLVAVIEQKGSSFHEISRTKDLPLLLRSLLLPEGLNYGNLPKGLIKFHRTFNGDYTPVYEHLLEGVYYAPTGNKVMLHFTVSPQHIDLFNKHLAEITPKLQKEFGVKFKVDFSIQKQFTDSIAVDENNKPMRNPDGSLMFRPGGHGALIHNLNDLDSDIIFIKNIDNVVQNRLKEDTIVYKCVLAGILLDVRKKAAGYYKKLNQKHKPEFLAEVKDFMYKNMGFMVPENYETWPAIDKAEYLRLKLNRPFRVCGMVPNEGEPGGGPFWIKGTDGSLSLQIIESSQFNDTQIDTLNKSTHFNPVDIVCSIKDFKGKKFDLVKFVDASTGFIITKSNDGVAVKALELPGLWNGAMADWNTLFVEVPISTFNPVKKLNDLLRAEHLFEMDILTTSELQHDSIRF